MQLDLDQRPTHTRRRRLRAEGYKRMVQSANTCTTCPACCEAQPWRIKLRDGRRREAKGIMRGTKLL